MYFNLYWLQTEFHQKAWNCYIYKLTGLFGVFWCINLAYYQAFYHADGVSLDLISLSRINGSLVGMHGGHLYEKCEDMETLQPVTFLTEGAIIKLPEWKLNSDGSSVEFTFQTNEPNGLLLHGYLGTSKGVAFLGVQMLKGD